MFMLMRTFLLVVIAATVFFSCVNVNVNGDVPVRPSSVSFSCYNSSLALSTPLVDLAESYIIKNGCENLNYDISSTRTICGYQDSSERWLCNCRPTFSNTSSWEYGVRNISSSVQICDIKYSVRLTGTKSPENVPIRLDATYTNYDLRAFGGDCNTTEIETGLEGDLAAILGNLEYSSLNANSSVTGVTWTSAAVTIYACDQRASRQDNKNIIPSTTATPTTPNTNTTTNNTTSSGSGSAGAGSGSGSSSNSNSTSTSSPSTVPPLTPTPTSNSSSSSSSSSTGGKGTGTSTGNGNGNGASVMLHSATAVMIALICSAVTVIGAA